MKASELRALVERGAKKRPRRKQVSARQAAIAKYGSYEAASFVESRNRDAGGLLSLLALAAPRKRRTPAKREDTYMDGSAR